MNKSGWLNINKPCGYTSTRVVNILKRILKCKKIGHGGTLDPFASGVLPVCLNSATKTVECVMDHSKTYSFSLVFGKSTDSFDIDGNILDSNDKVPTEKEILDIIPSFIGKIAQVPPKYSALKINGVRACDLVREGKDVLMESRDVEIFDLRLNKIVNRNTFEFTVDCGRGCYIRSLGVDIASRLGMLAYVSKLTRLRVGNFKIENSIDVKDFENINECCIIGLDDILDMPSYSCSEEEHNKLKNGCSIFNSNICSCERLKIKFNDDVICIANCRNNFIKSIVWLAC